MIGTTLDQEQIEAFFGYNRIGEEICINRRWECVIFDRMRARDSDIPQKILAFQVRGGKGKSLLLKRFDNFCKVDASKGELILNAKVDFRDQSLTGDSLVSEIIGSFIINAKEAKKKLLGSDNLSAAIVTQLEKTYEKIISQLDELDEEVENLTREQTHSQSFQFPNRRLARMFSNFCRLISEQWTVVLLLDTWEDAGKAGEWFLHDFIPKLVELDNVIAVLAGREGLSSLESRPDEVIFRTNLYPLTYVDDCQRWAELKHKLTISCNGLQKLSPRLAKTPVFGSDYFAKTPRCGSDYLQMDSHYLQTAHKNSSRLRLSAKTIFIMECQF